MYTVMYMYRSLSIKSGSDKCYGRKNLKQINVERDYCWTDGKRIDVFMILYSMFSEASLIK